MTHFVYMNTQRLFQAGKVKMVSTFQRNQHFRNASVNKTFTHVQEQKKPRHFPFIPSSLTSPLAKRHLEKIGQNTITKTNFCCRPA